MQDNIKKSVYKVITSRGSGTGFKVEGNDLVITNFHVIQGSKSVALEDQDKNRYLANVVMVNVDLDLAFLRADNLKDKESSIKINPDAQVNSTDTVLINGFPFGMPFTVTQGIVSSPNQPMSGRHFLQTDAAVNPGNSGGPMLNKSGELIAVTTSKFTNADNVGFGIPFKDVLKELEDFTFTDDVYRVKCNHCGNYIEDEVEFCPHCGADVDSSVFEEFEKSYFAEFTETALTELGINPVICRAGLDFWEFHQGSALVRIFVVDRNYLFATSPLNRLPKANLEDLLSYINSNNVPPYQLGIHEGKIFISYRAHLSDIYSDKKEQIKTHLFQMALKADDLDDFFVNNYGCEMSVEAKEV